MTATIPTQTLEERVTALEVELENLKAKQITDKPSDTLPWWEKIWGVFKEDADFAEAMQLGREYREALRHEDWSV